MITGGNMSHKDFGTVKETLLGFLSEKSIKEKMSHILDKGTNDWEKWFQIEFEYFIEHSLGYSAKREIRAIADKRHQSGRQHMYVDLIFRKKNTRTDRFIYLEFKLAKNPTTLVNNMWKDIVKNYEIVQSHFTSSGRKRRSVWSIGFYRNFNPTTLKKVDESLSEEYSENFYTYHESIFMCKCRGKKHSEECNKIGVIIIGSGSE